MNGIRILLFLSILSGWCFADEKTALATEVHRIFDAKCVDCHGSHLPKPKGKFGWVLDLERLGKTTKFVTPGDVADSKLYQMVEDNEMPGEDADVPPLTPAELKTVAAWIKAGAPGIPGEVFAAAPAPEVKKKRPFFTRLLAWVGKFHPASTHLPVGLLLAAVLAEGIAWFFKREEWLLVVRFLVVVGAASAPMVATLGWLVAKFDNHTDTITEWHRWLGVTTAGWAIVCAVLVCSSECEEGSPERKRFRGALLLGALLVSVTGFLGGLVTFGTDHYHW